MKTNVERETTTKHDPQRSRTQTQTGAMDDSRATQLVAAAHAALRAGNTTSARFIAERLLAHVPDDCVAHTHIAVLSARCLLAADRPRAAHSVLRPIVVGAAAGQAHTRSTPQSAPLAAIAPALFLYARCCVLVGELAAAENTLLLLLETHTRSPPGAPARVFVPFSVDCPSAEEICAVAGLSTKGLVGSDPMLVSNTEDVSCATDARAFAIDDLPLAARSALSEVYYLLGRVRQHSGRHREAIVAFRHALQLNDLNWGAFEALLEISPFNNTTTTSSHNEPNGSSSYPELETMFQSLSDPDKDVSVDEADDNLSHHGQSHRTQYKQNSRNEADTVSRSSTSGKSRYHTSTTTEARHAGGKTSSTLPQETISPVIGLMLPTKGLILPEFTRKQADTIVKDLQLCARAYTHLRRRESRECVATFNKLSPVMRNTAWVYYQMARANYDAAFYKESARLFKMAFAMEPWHTECVDIYGSCLWHLKDDVELAYLVKEITTLYRRMPQAWTVLANLYSLRQEHEKAIYSLNRAISLDNDYYYAYTLKGLECIFTDKLDEARQCFITAIRINPSHYNALYGLGNLAYRSESFKIAHFYFERALSFNNTNPILQCYMGLVVAQEFGFEEATPYFELAVSLDPESYVFKFRLAFAYASTGRYEDALTLLKMLEAAAPTESNVYFLQGRIQKLLGNQSAALLLFTKAQQYNKTSPLITEAIEAAFEEEKEFASKEVTSMFYFGRTE